jgi:hypothetical protein
MTVEMRMARMEKMLSKALHRIPERVPPRLPEKEVVARYNISVGRLKQLRLGCHKNGKYHAPRLYKWGHVNGRRIDYDVDELNKVFPRTIAGTV